MNPADAAELLTLAAAFDRRTIGKADAIAWADALADLNPRDCATAIRAHFRASTDYLMPVHVRTGAHAIRAQRVQDTDPNLFEPHDVDPDDIAAWLTARRSRINAIADGQSVPAEPVTTGVTRDVLKLAEQTVNRLPKMPSAQPQAELSKKRAAEQQIANGPTS